MSYNPTTDFLALLRQTAGGVRTLRMPGLDYVLDALARAGLFTLYVGYAAPTTNQSSTVWLLPATQSWTAEGTVFLWDPSSAAYEPATPALWVLLLSPTLTAQVQDVTTPGPINILAIASVVRVNQAAPAPIVLVAPLSSTKVGPVLVSDWRGDAGTNNITVNLTGADKFPGNLASWTVAADGGSIFMRPVPGGYAL